MAGTTIMVGTTILVDTTCLGGTTILVGTTTLVGMDSQCLMNLISHDKNIYIGIHFLIINVYSYLYDLYFVVKALDKQLCFWLEPFVVLVIVLQ